jgi:hypothetical protein
MISTRTLALTRFRRNHEFMDEVFAQAAMGESFTNPPNVVLGVVGLIHDDLGDRHPPRPPPAYSIFDKTDVEENVVGLITTKCNIHFFHYGIRQNYHPKSKNSG